jgi:hypothetical protein
MQWWNGFVEWLSSDNGWRVVTDAVIPFVAIVVAGIVAALIGRASTRRVVSLHEDEAKAAAVAALVSAARKGAVYSSLGVEERAYADHLGHEADVHLRLLPATGSTLAADWAAHELAEIKRNSASFSFQSEQTLGELRDRLVEWQNRPGRAKKLFRDDLARWKYEEADVDHDTAAKQKAWEAEQRSAPRPSTMPRSGVARRPTGHRRLPPRLSDRRRCPRPRHRPSRRVTRPTTTPATTRWTTSATSSRSVRARSAAARHPNARTTDHVNGDAPPTSVGGASWCGGVHAWCPRQPAPSTQ